MRFVVPLYRMTTERRISERRSFAFPYIILRQRRRCIARHFETAFETAYAFTAVCGCNGNSERWALCISAAAIGKSQPKERVGEGSGPIRSGAFAYRSRGVSGKNVAKPAKPLARIAFPLPLRSGLPFTRCLAAGTREYEKRDVL